MQKNNNTSIGSNLKLIPPLFVCQKTYTKLRRGDICGRITYLWKCWWLHSAWRQAPYLMLGVAGPCWGSRSLQETGRLPWVKRGSWPAVAWWLQSRWGSALLTRMAVSAGVKTPDIHWEGCLEWGWSQLLNPHRGSRHLVYEKEEGSWTQCRIRKMTLMEIGRNYLPRQKGLKQ